MHLKQNFPNGLITVMISVAVIMMINYDYNLMTKPHPYRPHPYSSLDINDFVLLKVILFCLGTIVC